MNVNVEENHEIDINGYFVIVITFVVAFWLSGLVLPHTLEPFRPVWVLMVLIYWTIAIPYRIGVYIAAVVGLLLDLYLGALMGQHVISLALVGYLAYLIHLRIRLFPIWQQCLVVLVMTAIYQVVNRVIEGMLSDVSVGFSYYWPTVSTAFFWPWVYVALRYCRKKFHIY